MIYPGGSNAAKPKGNLAQANRNNILNGAEKNGKTSLTNNPFEPPVLPNDARAESCRKSATSELGNPNSSLMWPRQLTTQRPA
jgi:hypothetical protein